MARNVGAHHVPCQGSLTVWPVECLLGPQLERLIDRLSGKQIGQQVRKSAGVEPVGAGDNVRHRGPAEIDIVLDLVAEAIAPIDIGTNDIETNDGDDLMLQATGVAVPKRRRSPPARLTYLLRPDVDARLFAQLAYRCFNVSLAVLDAAAGQLPPIAEFRHREFLSAEEQHLPEYVLDNQADHVALDHREIVGKLDHGEQ